MPIINQIVKGGGTTPTGTLQITYNGVHDVTNYANADVQVPTTAPTYYIEKSVDANGKMINSTNIINMNGITDVSSNCLSNAYNGVIFPVNTFVDMLSLTVLSGQYACNTMFMSTQGLTSANMSSLTTVSGSSACRGMFSLSNLTSIDLSSLTTVSGSYGCYQMLYKSKLTSVNLSSLTKISGDSACYSMFEGCNLLTNVGVSNLTSITGDQSCRSMMSSCSLTSIGFYSLCTLTGNQCIAQCLASNRTLQTVYFPSLTPNSFGTRTNQFNGMLQNVTGCTVHFPSNIQSVIGSWSIVTGGFGGTNTTVLFDLPATVTLTGADTIEYTRNPKYDTATALAWKVGAYGTTNFTPAYYTSGTTDPVANDTIYSDSACTTAVTTISSIA
jgi:hypothetical protein